MPEPDRARRPSRRLPSGSELAAFGRALRSVDRRSAVRSLGDGAFVAVTLKRRGARPLFTGRAPGAGVHDAPRAAEVSSAVDAGLGLLPIEPTCLRRSVTLLRELDRLGLASSLHIGVRTANGAFEALAWVQVGDAVVNDDPRVAIDYEELAGGELERLLPLLG